MEINQGSFFKESILKKCDVFGGHDKQGKLHGNVYLRARDPIESKY